MKIYGIRFYGHTHLISMNSSSQNCVMCIMHYGLLHALVECALNPGFRKLKIKLILEEGGW